jgi:hypothetical protein
MDGWRSTTIKCASLSRELSHTRCGFVKLRIIALAWPPTSPSGPTDQTSKTYFAGPQPTSIASCVAQRPPNLPVQLPSKFVRTVNLKTARTHGLTIPETRLTTADEVID